MMKYYYLENNEKRGPFTLSELKTKDLNNQTLVWFEGLEKWTQLQNIEELNELLLANHTTKYYIKVGDSKEGPYTLEDLEYLNVTPTTLIWTKELDYWTKAKLLDELEHLIVPEINKNYAEDDSENKNNEYSNESNRESSFKKTRFNNPNQNIVYNSNGYFQKPFSHKGRIARLEYFIVFLIFSAIYLLLSIISYSNYNEFIALLLLVIYFVNLYFLIVNTAKRCHDIGKSGWWQLIPFFGIYLFFAPGHMVKNEYGNPIS